MKKIAVVVIIAALSTFVWAPVASSGGNGWNGFHGDYAMTGSGNCFFSPFGFNPDNTPFSGGPSWGAYYVVDGVWSFERNGKGTFQGTQFSLGPPPLPPTLSPNSTTFNFRFEFEYGIAHDGFITGNMKTGTFLGEYLTGPNAVDSDGNPLVPAKTFKVDTFSFSGWVSKDHKTVTLNSPSELQSFTIYSGENLMATLPAICTTGRILIRIEE
jgi:hypothetical protein